MAWRGGRRGWPLVLFVGWPRRGGGRGGRPGLPPPPPPPPPGQVRGGFDGEGLAPHAEAAARIATRHEGVRGARSALDDVGDLRLGEIQGLEDGGGGGGGIGPGPTPSGGG